VILRGVSFRSMPAPTDLALILRQWRSRPMARSSRLPASRHGAGVGAVAQWRSGARWHKRGARFAAIAARQAFPGGTTHDGSRTPAPSGADTGAGWSKGANARDATGRIVPLHSGSVKASRGHANAPAAAADIADRDHNRPVVRLRSCHRAFVGAGLSNPWHLLRNSLHNAGADTELLADLEDAIALIPERHNLSLHGRLHSASS
jgi:hypothetical protein